MFSRPVSSGWKPVPTSIRLAIRRRWVTRPRVGSVVQLRIPNGVDLLAPLRSIMRSVSLRLTLKERSFSTKSSSTSSPWTMAQPPLRDGLLTRSRRVLTTSRRGSNRPERGECPVRLAAAFMPFRNARLQRETSRPLGRMPQTTHIGRGAQIRRAIRGSVVVDEDPAAGRSWRMRSAAVRLTMPLFLHGRMTLIVGTRGPRKLRLVVRLQPVGC